MATRKGKSIRDIMEQVGRIGTAIYHRASNNGGTTRGNHKTAPNYTKINEQQKKVDKIAQRYIDNIRNSNSSKRAQGKLNRFMELAEINHWDNPSLIDTDSLNDYDYYVGEKKRLQGNINDKKFVGYQNANTTRAAKSASNG